MRIVDCTQIISETMPVYPGTEAPALKTANSYEDSGFRETLLTMTSHTGTHMDAPAHLFEGRTTLDQFPVSQFAGTALVIDVSDKGEGDLITLEDLKPAVPLMESAEFLLFHTGWSRFWGTPQYFGCYPVLTPEVIDVLLTDGKKGVGLDTIGLDPIEDENLTLHRKLLKKDRVIIENLRGLDEIGPGLFYFCALPLKFEKADGAPVRAAAFAADPEDRSERNNFDSRLKL